MRYLLATNFLSLYVGVSLACSIDPFVTTSRYADFLMEKSDIVFFGKLTALETSSNGAQQATFEVIKHIAGKNNEFHTIVVKNEHMTTCFRPFTTIGSAYYIFGSKSGSGNSYMVSSSAHNGFLPLEWVVENDWSLP